MKLPINMPRKDWELFLNRLENQVRETEIDTYSEIVGDKEAAFWKNLEKQTRKAFEKKNRKRLKNKKLPNYDLQLARVQLLTLKDKIDNSVNENLTEYVNELYLSVNGMIAEIKRLRK